MVKAVTGLFFHLFTAGVGSETVDVRDRGPADLTTFECRDINRSSPVQRVCYEPAQRYLIVNVKGGYDQYCDLHASTFDGFMDAPSMGQFFNRNIRRSDGGRR